MLNNFIFDLDGTIINSSKEVMICFEKAFAKADYPIDKSRLTHNIIGPPLPEIVKLIAPEIDKNNLDKIVKNFHQIYDYDENDISEIYAGMYEFLCRWIKAAHSGKHAYPDHSIFVEIECVDPVIR